jgi:RNA polymerase sigma-70 factor (ECF subfamily)
MGRSGQRGTSADSFATPNDPGLEAEACVQTVSVGADFATVYHETYLDVWRYASFMLRDTVEGEDVAAETFVRAFQAWSTGRGPHGDSRPWLVLIARRIVLNRIRRARLLRWIPLVPTRDSSDPSRLLEETEFRVWLEQLASVLTSREREALFLRYLYDLDDTAAAAVLGVSASGMRTLVSRALQHLRERKETWQ